MTSKAFDNATDANRQQGGRRNLIINGAMQVWQRGTSLSAQTTNQYLADRWLLIASDSTYNVSQEDVGLADSTVPHEIEHFLRFNPTTGNNNTGVFQRIEDVRSLPEGKVAISFYAKGTNPNSGEIQVFFRQNFGTGGSAQTTEVVDTFVLTSSWQRFTVIHDVPSLSGKTLGPSNTSYVMIGFRQPDTDTSTDAWTLDITGVQLEVGTVASPFEHISYGEQLALCQRYYWQSPTGDDYKSVSIGFLANSTLYIGHLFLPTTLRSAPALSYSGSWQVAGTASLSVSSISLTDAAAVPDHEYQIRASVSGGTSGHGAQLRNNNDSTAYIELDAEL